MKNKNNKNLIKKVLQNLSGDLIYQRGFDYFQNKTITNLTIEIIENTEAILVSGEVQGEDIYVCNFSFDLKTNNILEVNCDCPYNHFCKHSVALILKFLEN